MMTLFWTVFLVVVVSCCAGDPVLVDPYDDCHDDSVFCMGAGTTDINFALKTGDSCIRSKKCNALFKAIKDEKRDEVTFKIYVTYGCRGHHVYVALTHRPIIISSPRDPPYDHFPANTPFMLAVAEKTKTQSTSSSDMFTVQPADNVTYYQEGGLKSRGHEQYISIHTFKAKLRGAMHGQQVYDFTGPIAPAVVVRFSDPAKVDRTKIETKSQSLPAMLLWDSHYPPLPDLPNSGFPLWAIIVIVTVVLLLVLVVIAVCCYVSMRHKKRT